MRLSIDRLSVGYGHNAVVSNIQLTAQIDASGPGKMIGVLGINGAGKSTLIRTITGLQPALAGEVLLDGKSIISLSARELAEHIAVVLTAEPLNQLLTVRELLEIGLNAQSNRVNQLSDDGQLLINKLLTDLKLAELVDRSLASLSDGQRQRALIGRALAQDTPILVLDEPLAHLDLHHQARIVLLLKQIALSGKLVIYSTHHVGLALRTCDEMLVLRNGTSVTGTPRALLDDEVIQSLFPTDLLQFDAASLQFVLRK